MKMAGIIFSNIYDDDMGELTKHRTVASLPFGGRYRQIDFVLSNMVNSNISTVGVITKYNYQSLMDHLGSCAEWDLNIKNGGLFILPPFGTGNTAIYKGKLEALYGAASFIDRTTADYIVLSDSTVICNIDYEDILQSHIKSGADITIVANKDNENANDIKDLVLTVENGKISDLEVNCIASENKYSGMGMFILSKEYLQNIINSSMSHGYCNFEREYLQRQYNSENINIKINLYAFENAVLRNHNIPAFFKNSKRLMDEKIRSDIFRSDSPVYTKVRDEIPSYYGDECVVNDCLIADGCNIQGTAENSTIFRDVTIEAGAVVQNSIIMQGSYISSGAHVNHIIIDKNVTVKPNRTLIGAETLPLIINKGQQV